MSGSQVSQLQNNLVQLGFYSKDYLTGYFGPRTEKSVWYLQRANGITATGIVGQDTQRKILELLVLSLGSRISLLQKRDVASAPLIVNIATSTDLTRYSIDPKPSLDLKKLSVKIQNLVNDEREKFFLNPIYWDDELAEIALAHSEDQAKDNLTITNPNLPCHYPIIRHEGLTPFGYSLKDRLSSRNVQYRYAGENIAMVPVAKDLLYLNPINQPIPKCSEVSKFEPKEGVEEDRLLEYRSVLEQSKQVEASVSPVRWVNKKWSTPEEVAQLAVRGWMNSPGHRENILRKEYVMGGIGISTVNDYLIITHDFTGR